jgi:hypothetical protein
MALKSNFKKDMAIYTLLFLLTVNYVCGEYIPKSELKWGGELPPVNTTLTANGEIRAYLINMLDKPVKVKSVELTGSCRTLGFNCNLSNSLPDIIPPKKVFFIETAPCTKFEYCSYATFQLVVVYNLLSEDGRIIEENKTTGAIFVTSLHLKSDGISLESDATYNWLSIDETGVIKRLPSEEDVEIQQRDLQRTISIVVIFVLLCAWFYLFKTYKENNQMRNVLVIILVLFILLLVSFYLLDYFTKGSYGS